MTTTTPDDRTIVPPIMPGIDGSPIKRSCQALNSDGSGTKAEELRARLEGNFSYLAVVRLDRIEVRPLGNANDACSAPCVLSNLKSWTSNPGLAPKTL